MKRSLYSILSFLLLLLLVACDSGRRERLQLEELERQNRADSLMTNDSLALALTNYFDRHGTPNEQLRAYYILGRTYADVGEAPRAIEAYNTAADRADTTAADCDYKTLSRVFAQMSDVYYCQGLYREELNSNQCAIRYGILAADTLAVLLTYAQQMDTYKRLMKPDSMLYVCETVTDRFRQVGYSSLAARLLCPPVQYLIDQHNYIKARHFLEVYECESGFFDENHNIMPGREVYYFTKGYYYLKTCQYDSAEYFFRKELATGKDLNNQNAGSYGLALLFQQTHKPDSAAKYALYSYAMNDSVYAHKATDKVAIMTALYNYTRYEREAQQSRIKAISAQLRFVVSAVIGVLILALAALLAYRYRNLQKKRLEEERHYRQLQESYRRTEKELSELRVHQEEFSRMVVERQESLNQQEQASQELNRLRLSEQTLKELISKKEADLARQEEELLQFRQKSDSVTRALLSEEAYLKKQEFYVSLVQKTNNGRRLSDSDWKLIRTFVRKELPQFHDFLKDRRSMLTDKEEMTCLLVRLYFKPTNIANALGIDRSIVTRLRGSMLKKMSGVLGKSKDADLMIRQIDHLEMTDSETKDVS